MCNTKRVLFFYQTSSLGIRHGTLTVRADEGFMATVYAESYASAATDAAVQANIVAVGYKTVMG